MEVAVIVIATCMVILTVGGLMAILIMLLLGFRLVGVMKRVEVLLEDVRREALPIMASTRTIVDDARESSRAVRLQIGQSEQLVQTTLKNVAETSTRIRDAVSGLTAILALLGKLMKMMSNRSK